MSNKQFAILGAILAVVIVVFVDASLITGFAGMPPLMYIWPAIAMTLLYMIGHEHNLAGVANIMVSGAVGIIGSLVCGMCIGYLVTVMPPLAGIGIAVGGFVFAFCALMGVAPMFFNNYGVLFFFVSSLFSEQLTVTWLIALALSAVFMACVFGLLKAVLGFAPIKLTFNDDDPQAEPKDGQR